MADSLITLTTDFGTADHLVGTMKGVILNIHPAARIVDINHHVTPFDILDGALSIASASRFFPPRTIHVVVVDPGVGTDRRPLLVSGDQQYFIAPDNGVLSVIFARESCTVRHVTAEHYFLNPISPTFHGRDIFAPVAAWLGKIGQSESFGEEISDYVRFTLPKPKPEGATLKGVILRIDAFGNLVTNLTEADVPAAAIVSGNVQLMVGDRPVVKMVHTFAQGAPGEPVAVIGSTGYLEIAVNRGNAARATGATRGAQVTLTVA